MPTPGQTRPRWRALAWAAILVLAALVRTWGARDVAGERGVLFLADSDPHYHVLQAGRILSTGRITWRDPGLDHPFGADVPWPPLFDLVLAGAGRLAGADGPGPRLEWAAAVVPVAFGLLAVVLGGLAAGVLLGAEPLLAALALAVLPASVDFTAFARPDQHAAEVPLFLACLLLFARAFTDGRQGEADRPPTDAPPPGPSPAATAGLAATLVATAWTWIGSALFPLFLAGAAALLHVALPARDPAAVRAGRALGWAGLGGAALLAATVLLFAPAGRLLSFGTGGIGGQGVLLFALAGAFGVALAAYRVRAPDRTWRGRALEVALAGAGLLGAALLVPAVRAGLGGGGAALARGNPWYAEIAEFAPLLSGARPLGAELREAAFELGLPLLAAPVALALLLRGLPPPGPARARRLAGIAWLAAFLVATLAVQRFKLYLAAPAAGALAVVIGAAVRAAGRRGRSPVAARAVLGAGLFAAAWPAAPLLAGLLPAPGTDPVRLELLGALRTLPALPGGEGVLAAWRHGHLVQYYAGKPVVASPFGTEGGPAAMQDVVDLFRSGSGEDFERRLVARRIGFVWLHDLPAYDLANTAGFPSANGPAPVVAHPDALAGTTLEVLPAYQDLVVVDLFDRDGAPAPGRARRGSVPGLRLVAERAGAGVESKLFQRVPGATILVRATPGGRVTGSVGLLTGGGRRAVFGAAAVADADGVARLRVPYATGSNGEVTAGPCVVVADGRITRVSLLERAVATGEAVEAGF